MKRTKEILVRSLIWTIKWSIVGKKLPGIGLRILKRWWERYSEFAIVPYNSTESSSVERLDHGTRPLINKQIHSGSGDNIAGDKIINRPEPPSGKRIRS